MPYGPNQQFYQPIYQPSYSQFSNFGYGQAPFGGFYQPPMMGMMGRGLQGGQQMGMAPGNMATNYGDFDPRFRPQQSNMLSGQATYLTDQFQPMMPPQQAQTQYQSTPYTAPQQSRNPYKRVLMSAAQFLPGGQQPQSTFPYSVNYGQPMLSPQPVQTQYRPIPYMTQSQIDTRNAAAAAAAAPPSNIYDSGGGYGDGGVGGDSGGIGMGADSTGEGVFKKGGNVDDGIASLLKK
jgi:hypothetical protein